MTVDSYTKLIVQSVMSLYMSVEEKCQDFGYTSPRVTEKDSGIWDDTFTLRVSVTGALTQTHSPEPMTNIMTFPVPTPVMAAWKESTITLADFKGI